VAGFNRTHGAGVQWSRSIRLNDTTVVSLPDRTADDQATLTSGSPLPATTP
jgi:hypothetical protein